MSNVRYLRGARFGRLGQMGDTSASDASAYANYARAIYQAINGDVVGGAYNAAITFAGPIAAIGNAIANYFNAPGKKDATMGQMFLDALVQNAGFGQVLTGKAGYRYLTPDGRVLLNPNEQMTDVARAIFNTADATLVGEKFKAWLATGSPYNGGFRVLVEPRALPPAVTDSSSPVYTQPSSASAPAPSPTPAPSIAPPAYTSSYVPPAYTSSYVPPAYVPSVTVPDSPRATQPVDPQTDTLIAQLVAQGASENQAYASALQSLVARGIPSSPQIQANVASAVKKSVAPQMASTLWMVLGLAGLLGLAYLLRES